MNDIEILELLSRKIEEQNSIIVSCSSIVNKKAEAKERTEYIEIKRFVENLIQRNKDLEEIEKEHKEENGRLREELSQYKRIDKLVSNITPEEVDTAIKRASEQFIEVSKVEKELIQLNKDEKTELKGMKGQDRYFVKQQYAAKREILEKVLKMKGR